jgi:hypothetical protein
MSEMPFWIIHAADAQMRLTAVAGCLIGLPEALSAWKPAAPALSSRPHLHTDLVGLLAPDNVPIASSQNPLAQNKLMI